MLRSLTRFLRPALAPAARPVRYQTTDGGSGEMMPPPEHLQEPPIPPYTHRAGESLTMKKARILYQSRKRGMAENGILLSSFAARYLEGFNESDTDIYDTLINQPTNDWDIFYWITGKAPVPKEYASEVFELLKEYSKNNEKEQRLSQPNLY